MNTQSIISSLRGRLFRQIILAISAGVILLSATTVVLTLRGFQELGRGIGQTLEQGNHETEQALDRTQSQVVEAIGNMERNASEAMSSFLSASLERELGALQGTVNATVTQGTETLATLLASFSQDAIIARNFAALTAFVKTASAQESVIYAVYYKPDGSPFTRYVNRQDPRVKALMEQGSGRTGFDKLLSAAKASASMQRVTRDISFDGKLLGRVELGVSTETSDRAMTEMNGRVTQLIASSAAETKQILDREGGALAGGLAENFETVDSQQHAAADAVLAAVGTESRTLMGWQIGIATGVGLIILAALCGFLLVRVIAPIGRLTETMDDIASGGGDLTRRLPEDRKDEIGELAGAFNRFVAKIQDIVARTGASTERLVVAAGQLARLAHDNREAVMTAGVASSRETVTKASQAGDSLDHIVATVATITDMNTQIASAAEQQTVVAGEIDHSVVQISELAAAAAGQGEQMAKASGELEALGEELRGLVGQFRV
jgi:methyl-accepting chemotaxis protein